METNMDQQIHSGTNTSLDKQDEIILLLREQNEMLKNFKSYVQFATEVEKDKLYHFRTTVIDLDMSIGTMIGFMFKWLVASIPMGIVAGILYAIVIGIFGWF